MKTIICVNKQMASFRVGMTMGTLFSRGFTNKIKISLLDFMYRY